MVSSTFWKGVLDVVMSFLAGFSKTFNLLKRLNVLIPEYIG